MKTAGDEQQAQKLEACLRRGHHLEDRKPPGDRADLGAGEHDWAAPGEGPAIQLNHFPRLPDVDMDMDQVFHGRRQTLRLWGAVVAARHLSSWCPV